MRKLDISDEERRRRKNERSRAARTAMTPEQRARDAANKRSYYLANKEAAKVRNRRYRASNPDKYRAASLDWYRRNRTRMHENAGIVGIPQERDTKCHICGGPGGKKGIQMDHCHATMKFRGWLCQACNILLGMARDSPDILLRAAAYVKRALNS